MRHRLITLLLSVAVIASLIVVGCAPEAVAPEEEAPPSAPEAEVFHWKASHFQPAASITYKQADRVCDIIRVNTDGRLDIELYPAGAIVPAYEGMKACEAGTVDVAFCCYPANVGILGRATYLTHNTIAGLNSIEFLIWYYHYGGKEWQDQMLEDAGFTSVNAMWAMCGPELFGHFNKKITSIDDFRGLKFRTMGIWGKILTAQFGASVVSLPPGELYESMKSGVIDAFEFGTPTTDWDLGFHEVSKYLVVPGIHTPQSWQPLLINRDKWNSLPDDIKDIVMNACKQSTGQTYVEKEWLDSQTIGKFIEYGNELLILPEEVQKEIAYAAYAYYDELAAEDPFFAEGLESQRYVHSIYQSGGGVRVPVVPSYDEYKASH